MSPEQARGLSVDHRADLFSLGCVLYHMATGQRPFAGDDPYAILTALAIDSPKPPCDLNPALPLKLSDLIMKLLAKDPASRPQSAKVVVDALTRIASAKPGDSQEMSSVVRARANMPGQSLAPPEGFAPGIEEHVRGLQVPMEDSALMGVQHCTSHGRHQPGSPNLSSVDLRPPTDCGDRNLCYSRRDAAAFQQRHGEVLPAGVLSDIENRHDVRMFEGGGRLDAAAESTRLRTACQTLPPGPS